MQYARLGALAIVMVALVVGVAYLGMLLVETASDLDTKTVALAEQESTNTVLDQTNRTLMTDLAKLEVYLEGATNRYGELSSENVSLQSELVAASDRYALLEEQVAILSVRLTELTSAHDALTERHDALESDYGDLDAEYTTLAQRNAELARLSERLPALQKRIAALEAQLASDGEGQ